MEAKPAEELNPVNRRPENRKAHWLWLLTLAAALGVAAVFRREQVWLLVLDLVIAFLCAFMAGISWLGQKKQIDRSTRRRWSFGQLNDARESCPT